MTPKRTLLFTSLVVLAVAVAVLLRTGDGSRGGMELREGDSPSLTSVAATSRQPVEGGVANTRLNPPPLADAAKQVDASAATPAFRRPPTEIKALKLRFDSRERREGESEAAHVMRLDFLDSWARFEKKSGISEGQREALIAVMYDWQENLWHAEMTPARPGETYAERRRQIEATALELMSDILDREQLRLFSQIVFPNDLSPTKPILAFSNDSSDPR